MSPAIQGHRRAVIDPKITEHRGRVVETTGDGVLVEFASVVDAVRCAALSISSASWPNATPPSRRKSALNSPGPKNRAAFATSYGAGLRASEVVALKIG